MQNPNEFMDKPESQQPAPKTKTIKINRIDFIPQGARVFIAVPYEDNLSLSKRLYKVQRVRNNGTVVLKAIKP